MVSTNVISSRVKRHLLNRQRASIKQEKNTTTDSPSTNERTPQTTTTTVSSKRMEYLRKVFQLIFLAAFSNSKIQKYINFDSNV